jgi:hypothetical protein
MAKVQLVGILALVFVSGCMIAGSKSHFMSAGAQKAAFDMHCSQDKLEIVELGGGSMGVRGCGKQGRYEWVNGAGWVLNSAEDQAAR